MLKKLSALIILMLSVFATGAYSSDNVTAGDVIVVLRNSSGARISSSAGGVRALSAVQSFTRIMNVEVTSTFDALSESSNTVFMVIHSDTKNENDLLREVRANPNVIASSLNHVIRLSDNELTPNDPEYYQLWGMQAINAPSAWTRSTGSDDVYVAVIDTGLDPAHPDLAGHVAAEYCRSFFEHTSRDYDPSAWQDVNDHGTHCAGTIAAVGNNSEGVAGVNWRAKIIAVRVFGADGRSTDADTIAGFNYVAELLRDNPNMNIASVNMSFGGYQMITPEENSRFDSPYWLALKILSDTNRTVICVAAGNEDLEVGAPVPNNIYSDGQLFIPKGSYSYSGSFLGLDNMIVVAAADSTLTKASFSNYSPNFVDIASPGASIFSTVRTNASDDFTIDEFSRLYPYTTKSGTSMATPHVAGAAALLKAIFPDASASEIKAALLGGANRNHLRADGTSQHGLLDLEGAIDFMDSMRAESEVPVIRDSQVHGATVNRPYRMTFCASGTGPVTWSIDGELPEGLTFSDGSITGTPLSDGTATFIVTAENDYGSDSRVFTISSDSGVPPEISADKSLKAYRGVYREIVAATSSGTWPMTWSLGKSNLPGIDLDAETGVITFTPSEAGEYSFTLLVSNYAGTDSMDFTVSVSEPELPTLQSKDLIPAVRGMLYGAENSRDVRLIFVGLKGAGETIDACGADLMSLDVQGLPSGLEFEILDMDDLPYTQRVRITGRPEETGSFDVIISVSNESGTISRDYPLSVTDSALEFTSNGSIALMRGVYSSHIITTTGSGPVTFRTSGDFPDGLSLSAGSNSALLEGIPTTAGTYNFTLFAENGIDTVSKDMAITVTEPAVITTHYLSDGVKGEPYDFKFDALNEAALSWSMLGDVPGLALTSDGRLTGTPVEAGNFEVVIAAALPEDSLVSDAKLFGLTILERPEITAATLPDGVKGSPYGTHVLTAEGTGPLAWSLDGALPAGLSLAGNGYIFGTPIESGAFTFTLRVRNSAGEDSRSFTVNIASDGTSDTPTPGRETGTRRVIQGQARGVSSLTLGELGQVSGNGRMIAAVLPEVSVSESGVYTSKDIACFGDVVLSGDVPAGYVLDWHGFVRGSEVSVSDEAVFYGTDGEETAVVPEDHRVSVSAYLEAGKVYAPVIAARPNVEPGSSGGGCDSGLLGVLLFVPLVFRRR